MQSVFTHAVRTGLRGRFVRVIAQALVLTGLLCGIGPEALTAPEQQIEITIRDATFIRTKTTPVLRGLPTAIVLRNQDRVRHGFTSSLFQGTLVRGEGEGAISYGKGLEGFYLDPGKTLVIRFTTDRPGSHSFRCDLHPDMKGELFLLEIPIV